MDKFIVRGGVPLEGEIPVSGAKNSALPALAACLLTAETVTLKRVPRVRDVRTMERLLRLNGATVQSENGGTVSVTATEITRPEAPYDVVKTMRASSLVLGPLLARTGRARVSLPGGCAIGARPINLHLAGLEQLGATVRQEHGYIEAEAPNGLKGTLFHFDRITVTGTEDLLMAAVLAEGETVLENAAREPEVADLAELLIKMGAEIEGAGTSTIRVRGVGRLHGAEHTIIPDRIEAGTYLIAGAITGGDLLVSGCNPEHLAALIAKLRQAGVEVSPEGDAALRVRGGRRLQSVDVVTEEYPGFATDLQAQFMALMTVAEGTSIITETVFENRFMHIAELQRMGAEIHIEGRTAVIEGVEVLSGAQVTATDLRAGAALVIAGLMAEGQTIVQGVHHIDRGYDDLVGKFQSLGALIQRMEL
ncbi:MAG: UDP-N-acetylglucosamine 1-carboxyvinyltransferase [Alicyclobacillus sp.]|nr:UDP-N-acetylglucosamine 1-carboxyvinyltransferase [Alicyclobacillus sp.]